MDDLVTLIQLSRLVKLPEDWLNEQANTGQIPCLDVGTRRLFSLKAVRAALAKLAATSVASGGEYNA